MSFFNKSEEVIDIQLTRFGKVSLSRGKFKPKYYQFFDDDIVYQQRSPNYSSENQNETQNRILLNTPRNKPSPVSLSVERTTLESGFSINPQIQLDPEMFSREDQERLLLYPLSHCEAGSTEASFIEVSSHGVNINKNYKEFLHYTSSGIYRKIPQLKMNVNYEIVKTSGVETTQEELRRSNNSNNFIDLRSNEIEFLDKSMIQVEGDKIILSVEEANSFYGLSNFELEIYEIDNSPESSEAPKDRVVGPNLKRIKNIEDINSLFHIKTDEDVVEVKTKFGRQNNWYRTGE